MNEKNSLKSQGAIEYLIIIGTVITIAAVAMVIVSGALGQRQEEILYDQCSSAASRCNTRRAANPEAACRWCEDQCVDNDGNPLFGEEDEINAIDCCMLGLDDEIFLGAGADGEYEENCEPTLEPDFTYSISEQEVYFDGRASSFSPYHPDYEITHYDWNFDDGNTTSSESTTSHEYSQRDEYDVELTVTGEGGGETFDKSITRTVRWEGFYIDNVTVDDVEEGEELEVKAEIRNVGDEKETQEVKVDVVGLDWSDSEYVDIPGGGDRTVTFNYDTEGDGREENYTAVVGTDQDSQSEEFYIYRIFKILISSGDNGRVVEPGEDTFEYREGKEITIGAQADQEVFNETTLSEADSGGDGHEETTHYEKTDVDVSEALELELKANYQLDTTSGDSSFAAVYIYVDGEEEFKHLENSANEDEYVNGTTVDVSNKDNVEVEAVIHAWAEEGSWDTAEVKMYWASHEPDEPGDYYFSEWTGQTDELEINKNERVTNATINEGYASIEAKFGEN